MARDSGDGGWNSGSWRASGSSSRGWDTSGSSSSGPWRSSKHWSAGADGGAPRWRRTSDSLPLPPMPQARHWGPRDVQRVEGALAVSFVWVFFAACDSLFTEFACTLSWHCSQKLCVHVSFFVGAILGHTAGSDQVTLVMWQPYLQNNIVGNVEVRSHGLGPACRRPDLNHNRNKCTT